VVAGTGLLLVLSNGPVLRFASGVLDRPGLWNDPAIWPFFAGAAAVSVVLAWATRRPGGGTGLTGWDHPVSHAGTGAALSRPALAAIGWYSAAAVASSLWSVYPSATLWRSVVYLGLVLLAVVLAGLTDDQLSTVLVLLASVAVAGSLAVVVLQHDVGTDRDGNWIGMYTNRNSLAPLAALGVIAGLHWLLRRPMPASRYRRGWGAVLVAASLVTLVGAGSRTAWLSLAAALAVASTLGVMAAASRLRIWRPWQTWAAAAGGALAAVGVGMAVVAAAWDVPTFLQRRTIWGLVWDRVLERPWGGYGFFAFWEVPELVAEHLLLQRGSAHNSLVETALGLGVVGTLPFAMLVVLAAVNAGRGLWLRPSPDTGMWAAVTVFVLCENVTESFVLWFSHIWVLLLAAALRRPIAANNSRKHTAAT
jgi:O-antigen ligase